LPSRKSATKKENAKIPLCSKITFKLAATAPKLIQVIVNELNAKRVEEVLKKQENLSRMIKIFPFLINLL